MSGRAGRVLLTGGSGYVAAHVLKLLLDRGYWVRFTVRSESKARTILDQYPNFHAQLDYIIVTDFSKAGTFDDSVTTNPPLDFVIHTASPVVVGSAIRDTKDVLRPAIDGTLELLKSVKKFAPSVKRVVITGSCVSVINPFRPNPWNGKPYTEEDWNPVTEVQGRNDPALTYSASKVVAERAAWDFVKDAAPNFDLVHLNPCHVLGPVLNDQDLDNLNHSVRLLTDYIFKGRTDIPPGSMSIVDVRDVAEIHVASLTNLIAGGQRFNVASPHIWSEQTAIDIVRENFPELKDKLPVGNPGVVRKEGGHYFFDVTKVESIFGIKWHAYKDTIIDTVTSVLPLQTSV